MKITGPRAITTAAFVGYLILHTQVGALPWQASIILVTLMFGRTALSLLYKPSTRRTSVVRRAALVLPFFNEDEETLRRTLGSIVAQTRLPDALYIVNDGSPIGGAEIELWLPFLRDLIPHVDYIEFSQNQGKRSALCAAIKRTDCDIVITTDSDTTLQPQAIEELVRPFASRKVTAVTGRIAVRNRVRNPLTLLQDLIYAVAFLNGRAALSQMGSILVCSGALSAYRRTAVAPYMDDFVRNPWMFGEDRHLTNYALKQGRVVMQGSAVARTDVPQGLGHYLKQQTRWQRGFLQQSAWILRHFPIRHRVFWMTFGNLAIWLFLTLMLPLALASGNIGGVLLYSVVAHLLVSWSRLSHYVGIRGEGRFWTRLAFFLIGPLVSFAQTLLLTPVRLYGLLTFNAKGWGSRVRAAAARA